MENNKIKEEEILENWGEVSPFSTNGNPKYLTYLLEILNKEISVDKAIEDIKSFRRETRVEKKANTYASLKQV